MFNAFMVVENMTFPESLLISLLGLLVVFTGLIALMAVIFVIKFLAKFIDSGSKKAPSAAPAAAAAPAAVSAAPAADLVPAPGSSGEIKLNGVDDRTAAMLMAIAADELNIPLNELRFISIREIAKA